MYISKTFDYISRFIGNNLKSHFKDFVCSSQSQLFKDPLTDFGYTLRWSEDPTCWYSCFYVMTYPECSLDLMTPFSHIENGKNDRTSFSRLGHKKIEASILLVLNLLSLTRSKGSPLPSCEFPCGQVLVAKNLMSLANSQ